LDDKAKKALIIPVPSFWNLLGDLGLAIYYGAKKYGRLYVGTLTFRKVEDNRILPRAGDSSFLPKIYQTGIIVAPEL